MENFTGKPATGFKLIHDATIVADERGMLCWDGYLENDEDANFIVLYHLGGLYIIEIYQNQKQVRWYEYKYKDVAIREYSSIRIRMGKHLMMGATAMKMLDTCEFLSDSPLKKPEPNPFFGQVRKFIVYNKLVWEVPDETETTTRLMTESEWNNRLWEIIRKEEVRKNVKRST